MNPDKKTARLAGLIYLVVVLTGIFSLAYVPSRLIVWNNSAQTFQNIASSTLLFRLNVASSMLCYLAFLLLPFILYKLLRPVHETYARLMIVFVAVSIPIAFVNLQNLFSVLTLVNGVEYLNVFGIKHLQAQVLFYLDNYFSGILILQIFWGLWLLPFGYLVYKSNFLPKLLGVLLIFGCFGYVIKVFGETVIPDFTNYVVAQYITMPASLGEIGIYVWLLVFGIRTLNLKKTLSK